jgi:PHD/YefM family antitoxin component YafN of YafNO toxin-antitoxin module
MKQLKKSKRPVVLTVRGKAAAIVQDAEAYQRLLDVAARTDAEEGIRQGLEDVKIGKTRPALQAIVIGHSEAQFINRERAKVQIDRHQTGESPLLVNNLTQESNRSM